MKRNKKFITIFLIIIIVFIFILVRKNVGFGLNFDDILFLKTFQKNQDNIEKKDKVKRNELDIMQYMFVVSLKNADFNQVNLTETINTKTLINEKIAPGLEGMFDIVLYANESTKYNIKFESLTAKPKNLRFQEMNTKAEAKTLEELEKSLVGDIEKDEQKVISVRWYWPYDESEKEDKQDTIDSLSIEKYFFNIYVTGEAI